MSGIAESGLQRSEGCLNSTIVKIVASLLLMLGVVTGGGALADQRLESFDEMVPQRPGMKTEEDYQRFVFDKLSKLPNIATYRSTLIMRVVKHTTVLPL